MTSVNPTPGSSLGRLVISVGVNDASYPKAIFERFEQLRELTPDTCMLDDGTRLCKKLQQLGYCLSTNDVPDVCKFFCGRWEEP